MTNGRNGRAAANRRPLERLLVVCGALILILLASIVLLLVNFPAGYNTRSGLDLDSVALFRSLWPYPTMTLRPEGFRLAASFAVLGLWALYFVSFGLVWRRGDDDTSRTAFKKALALACVFNIGLAFYAPPILSADLWHYTLFGRMVSVYHQNPYVIPASSISEDLYYPLAIWRETTTQYGPLWTMIEAMVAWLVGSSVLSAGLSFKVIGAAANIGGAVAVADLARRIGGGSGVRAVVIYAWNPAVLLEGAGSGHNDATMAALAVIGLALAGRRRWLPAVALVVASAMVKYLTFLLLAILGIYVLAREKTPKQVAVQALRISAVTALVTMIAYAPFARGLSPNDVLTGLVSAPNPMPNPIGIAVREWAGHPFGIALDGDSVLLLSFVLFLALLAFRLLLPRADLADVSSRYAWASFVYCYVVFAGTFTWYLISPAAAIAVSKKTLGTFCFVVLTMAWGFWLMLTGYANPVATAAQ